MVVVKAFELSLATRNVHGALAEFRAGPGSEIPYHHTPF